MRYEELRELKEKKNGVVNICLFGAGLIGSTWAYDLLSAMGFHIDFYCDNGKKSGVEIRNGIKTISLEELYAMKENVLVFITVTDKYQRSIEEQLEKNSIYSTVRVDYSFMQIFIESLLEMNDKHICEKFKFVLDDSEYISKRFEYFMGYCPNLDSPQTFNEKIQWLKLHDRNPKYTQMVDKYEVKKYISDKIGEDYIVPTLGVYDTFDEIDFEELPQQFVLKCTHDSGSIVTCRDKDIFDIKEAKNKLENRLKKNFYWIGREWPYKNVKPKIIAETMLMEQSVGEGIIDYKFYCFNGKPKYLYISAGLEDHATAHISFYNLDLTEAAFQRTDYRQFDTMPRVPQRYGEMIEIAEILSQKIPFVRIDLYEIDGAVYFSEFTFSPCGGMMPFNLKEYDEIIGTYIELSGLRNRKNGMGCP